MKIALLVSGIVRKPAHVYEKCLEDAISLFSCGSDNKVDVFYKTWSTEQNMTKIKEKCFYFDDTEPCPTQQDLDQINFPTVGQLKAYPEHIICRISHYAMCYTNNTLAKEANKKGDYDLYVRFRNDLSVTLDVNLWLQTALQEKTYVTAPQYWMGTRSANRLNDHIGIATPEVYNKIWSYETIQEKYNSLNAWSFEDALGNFVATAGTGVTIFDTNTYVLKRGPERGGDWLLR
jgi:hypothetical protein